MSRILVVYHSYDEQTARIAKRMGEVMQRPDHQVVVERFVDGDLRDFTGFDAVVIGGAVRYGHHDRKLERAVRRSAGLLAGRPNAFFSVCLSVKRNPKEAQGYLDGFCQRTGWQPGQKTTFAGALQYSKYPPFRKLLMRLISRMAGGDTDTTHDYEYTDWAAVERFAAAFVDRLAPVPAARAAA